MGLLTSKDKEEILLKVSQLEKKVEELTVKLEEATNDYEELKKEKEENLKVPSLEENIADWLAGRGDEVE